MSDGRIYSVVFENLTVGGGSPNEAIDLIEITPADDKPCEIVGLMINQNGVSDVGDAEEELVRIQVVRGHTSGGSGGSAPTPRPVKRTDAAAGFTAETGNTTIASGGSTVTLHADSFNVRVGYQMWWPPGTEPDATQADTTIVVRLPVGANDQLQLTGTVYVREQG